MTRTEPAALKAFATIRFEGDALDVSVLDDLLHVRPTLSYGRGERYTLGRRGIERVGKTGYWFLSTKTYLETSDLDAHISFIIKLLTDSRTHAHRDHKYNCLKNVMEQGSLAVLVTLFWFGRAGSRQPDVSSRLMSLVAGLGGGIETDFTIEDAVGTDLMEGAD